MAIIKKSTSSKYWRGCGGKGTLLHCWWVCKLVQQLSKTVWSFLNELKIELPYDPTILLLGKYPEKMKTLIKKATGTPVFTAALFTITKTWKQLKRPLTERQIRKMWYIYAMGYSVQFSSVAQSYLTLCDPMNRSTPGLPVHHQLPDSCPLSR